ncbi:MAG: DUF817 domain-containing protein [Planctomycetes bacterium]|nr:DUF817 domain-containing protein [Planctomycetota bacterium]
MAHDPRRPAWARFVAEVGAFGWKEARSCAFAGFILAALALTRHVEVPGLPRYDLLLLLCVGFQLAMVLSGSETPTEVAAVCLFHALGLGLELWKVHHGSWSYPDEAWSKVGGVPLYSGFMYASVGSYVCQAWRRLELRFHGWPPTWLALLLCAGAYGNFFTNSRLPDARGPLFLLVALVFARSQVTFVPNGPRRRMPVLLSFALIGLFIWLAENMATLLEAWRYPHQASGWRPVHLQKITSWWLLVVVSIVVVAELRRRATGGQEVVTPCQPRPPVLRSSPHPPGSPTP